MSPRPEHIAMLNREAVVRNPGTDLRTEWRGLVVGFYDEPTVIIRLNSGAQMALPAAWLEVTPNPPDSGSTEEKP